MNFSLFLFILLLPCVAFSAPHSKHVKIGGHYELMPTESDGEFFVTEGDILVDPVEGTPKGNSTRSRLRKWRKGIIPYVISSKIAASSRQDILNAIKHYHEKTNIKFVKRKRQKSYIFFRYNGKEGSCSSFVGKRGGRQTVNIPEWCTKGSIIHELGHASGLFHEHNRSDRDKYIKIKWKNIKKNKKSNYFKRRFAKRHGAFDFNSIMLYPSFSSFSVDPELPNITKRDGSTYLANREELSKGDIKALNKLYPGR